MTQLNNSRSVTKRTKTFQKPMRNRENEWINVKEYLPSKFDLAFELVNVLDEYGKCDIGWWNGNSWDFGGKKPRGKIVAWKRHDDYFNKRSN